MSKQQWDIWTLDFPGRGEHPAVLVSHPDRCARAAVVNVLYCTSQRQSRAPHPYEVLLNGTQKSYTLIHGRAPEVLNALTARPCGTSAQLKRIH